MEIILNKVSCSSVNEERKLNNVSCTFKSSNITFVSGISGRLLRDLLIGKKIKVNGSLEIKPAGTIKDIGYLSNNPLKEFKTKTVYDEMNYLVKFYELDYEDCNKKMYDALKLVGLNDGYLRRNFGTLSTTEIKRVQLALVLFYNPLVYIFDYYEKGFNYKDIDYLKKVLRRLKGNYGKNIIIVSDNIGAFLDTLDDYIIFHKGKVVVTGDKRDLYNEDLYKYIKCPKIIEFIKMVKDKDINLSNYLDINELIKGIYRSVEGK